MDEKAKGQGAALGLKDAIMAIVSDSKRSAIAALVLLALSLLLPTATLTVRMFGATQQAGLSGAALFGGYGWITVVAFATAVASRCVGQLAPYGRLIDYAALGAWAIAAVTAITGSHSATASLPPQLAGVMNSLMGGGRDMISLSPSFGVLPFVLSALALFRALRLAAQRQSGPQDGQAQ